MRCAAAKKRVAVSDNFDMPKRYAEVADEGCRGGGIGTARHPLLRGTNRSSDALSHEGEILGRFVVELISQP